jgi:hypothetical protein
VKAGRFTAVEGVTFLAPVLTGMACGCQVELDTGAVHHACREIYGAWQSAQVLAATGRRSAMLDRLEERIRAHLAEQAVMPAAEQEGLGI